MNAESSFIRVLLVATVALAPGAALAQGPGAGLDSTTWFAADIRHTVEGCELVQLRDVSWEKGQGRLSSGVPLDARAVVRPRRVREIQTRATDGSDWSPVDVAWFRARRGPDC